MANTVPGVHLSFVPVGKGELSCERVWRPGWPFGIQTVSVSRTASTPTTNRWLSHTVIVSEFLDQKSKLKVLVSSEL